MCKCKHDGCNKIASFNNMNEEKGFYCFEHKEFDMVDIKHKKCQYDGCNKRAKFKNMNQEKGLYCFEHKN